MGTFTRMAFDPVDGLKDKDIYVSTPTTEDAAREQVQGISDQLKDYINDGLLAELENAETGISGANKIGSQAIVNVTGTTVFEQIYDLKSQLDEAVTQGFTTGMVGTNALADDAVTLAKIAADAVGENQIIDGSVTASKLAAGVVSEAKLAAGAVSSEKLGTGAVLAAKIADSAVTETKLGAGAVTVTKLADDAVETAKIKDANIIEAKLGTGAVTTAKIADSAVTSVKIADAAVTSVKIADDAVGDDQLAANDRTRKITISASAPSGGSDGDIWLEIVS